MVPPSSLAVSSPFPSAGNPALKDFPAKNTAPLGCSGAPHLAVGCYRNLGVKRAGWVGVAGACRARWVEELPVTLQEGVGSVSGVSGSSHPPPPLGCAAAAHVQWGKDQASGKLGMAAAPCPLGTKGHNLEGHLRGTDTSP